MNIDYALILAAGFGTRMGHLGKELPKPLWPIFSASMLEIQIQRALDLGIKKIYINTHHQSEAIQREVLSKFEADIKILIEDEILGTGGAIFNLLSTQNINDGKLLLMNSDVFYMFDTKFFESAIGHLKDKRAVLFGLHCNIGDEYNELVLEDGNLSGIIHANKSRDYITYSGMCLINVDNLKRRHGKWGLFGDVLDYENEKIKIIVPDQFEYFDFGTKALYESSLFRLIKSGNGLFYNFLKKHKFFDPSKMSREGYNCTAPGILNFSSSKVISEGATRAIVLSSGTDLKLEKDGIYLNQSFDDL